MKKAEINRNIKAHDSISDDYERMHSEIFNPIEQERLRKALDFCSLQVGTGAAKKTALDYGCGSGNLSSHLIQLGFSVISADVSRNFLKKTAEKFASTGTCRALMVNGSDLSGVKDGVFDLSAAYSVLHHVPDYLGLIKELIRVTRPGGIIYLDHERNDSFWEHDPTYIEFLKKAKSKTKFSLKDFIQKYTRPSNYIDGLLRFFRPRYQREGDIHVWPDDHIEWEEVEKILSGSCCRILLKQNYLLFNKYPRDIYHDFKDKCSDYRLIAARKGY